MTQAAYLLSATAIALSVAHSGHAGTLTLTVNTQNATGTLHSAMFDSQAAFDSQTRLAGAAHPAQGGTSTITFNDLKPGTYGVAVFLDTNGNNRLDRNLFGAPTEPYGFSMNPTIGLSAPRFDAFSFDHDGRNQHLTIQLNGN